MHLPQRLLPTCFIYSHFFEAWLSDTAGPCLTFLRPTFHSNGCCSGWLSVCVIWLPHLAWRYVFLHTCSVVIMGKNSWLIGAGDSDMKFFHLLGGKVYSEIYSHGCTEIPVGSCSGCPWVISLMTHRFLVSPFSAFHSRFLWLLPQINHLFQAAFSGKPKLGQHDFWILQWTESCFVLLF